MSQGYYPIIGISLIECVLTESMKQLGNIQKSIPMWKMANQTIARTTAVPNYNQTGELNQIKTYKETQKIPRNVPDCQSEPFRPNSEKEEEEGEEDHEAKPHVLLVSVGLHSEDVEPMRSHGHMLRWQLLDEFGSLAFWCFRVVVCHHVRDDTVHLLQLD